MKKTILIIAILVVIGAGCGAKEGRLEIIGDKAAKQKYRLADSSNWDIDKESPEWLALYSSNIYKEMLDGTMSCEEGLKASKSMATAAGNEQLKGMESEFEQDIQATIESLKNNEDDKIKRFYFSECMKDKEDEERSTIYRIQEMESGKVYYFKQDFIQESGQWKVYGNNVENPFILS